MVERLNVKYYSADVDVELDGKLERVLAVIGYKRWASGHNLVNERDLCFDYVGRKEAENASKPD